MCSECVREMQQNIWQMVLANVFGECFARFCVAQNCDVSWMVHELKLLGYIEMQKNNYYFPGFSNFFFMKVRTECLNRLCRVLIGTHGILISLAIVRPSIPCLPFGA